MTSEQDGIVSFRFNETKSKINEDTGVSSRIRVCRPEAEIVSIPQDSLDRRTFYLRAAIFLEEAYALCIQKKKQSPKVQLLDIVVNMSKGNIIELCSDHEVDLASGSNTSDVNMSSSITPGFRVEFYSVLSKHREDFTKLLGENLLSDLADGRLQKSRQQASHSTTGSAEFKPKVKDQSPDASFGRTQAPKDTALNTGSPEHQLSKSIRIISSPKDRFLEEDFYQCVTQENNYEGKSKNSQPLECKLWIRGRSQQVEEIAYYVGSFKCNKLHGQGKLYYDDKASILLYDGEFKFNMKNGKGRLYNIHKDLSFEGEFANDLKHGEGTSYDATKQPTMGIWKYGKLTSNS